MKRRSIVKTILYTLGSIAIILSLAIWVFLSFYFEGTLNKIVIPKIEQAAFKATRGRFVLTLDKISYKHGTLVCNTFILSRVAYDSSEHGMVLDQLTLDTARFEGISWWDVLWGKDLAMTSLQLNMPKLYMANVNSDTVLLHLTNYIAAKKSVPSNVPVISFDSIVLHDISIFLPKPSGNAAEPTYRNITLKLTDFYLDPKRVTGEPVLFSKRVDFELPDGSYPLSDSMYSLKIRGVRGSFSDSLITIDTFAYEPNYSEQAFADMHKYVQGRLEFVSNGITAHGVNYAKFLSGEGVSVHSCEAVSWNLDYYRDLRKQHDPHPPDAVLPNAIINSIKAPITLDTLIFNNGTIRHRERAIGSSHPGLLTFTHTRVSAYPFCTDTSSTLYDKPLHITVNALFMGQGKVDATILYPIHHKTFDLQVDATVGPFDVPVLNSYLITNERKKITKGKCLGGELHMDVKSGIGITTVTPRYSDVLMDVLATDAKQSRGIFEGIKTFIANSFVLRTNNVDNGDSKAISGVTTYIRSSKEEFFQFIWLALRKSIAKVVGF